jgi:hypothetical protein
VALIGFLTTEIMHKFYVDVAANYQLDWSLSSNVSEVIRKQTGAIEVFFIANSIAKLSKGDCYVVTLPTSDDEIFYILKTGFDRADRDIVEAYLAEIGLLY